MYITVLLHSVQSCDVMLYILYAALQAWFYMYVRHGHFGIRIYVHIYVLYSQWSSLHACMDE